MFNKRKFDQIEENTAVLELARAGEWDAIQDLLKKKKITKWDLEVQIKKEGDPAQGENVILLALQNNNLELVAQLNEENLLTREQFSARVLRGQLVGQYPITMIAGRTDDNDACSMSMLLKSLLAKKLFTAEQLAVTDKTDTNCIGLFADSGHWDFLDELADNNLITTEHLSMVSSGAEDLFDDETQIGTVNPVYVMAYHRKEHPSANYRAQIQLLTKLFEKGLITTEQLEAKETQGPDAGKSALSHLTENKVFPLLVRFFYSNLITLQTLSLRLPAKVLLNEVTSLIIDINVLTIVEPVLLNLLPRQIQQLTGENKLLHSHAYQDIVATQILPLFFSQRAQYFVSVLFFKMYLEKITQLREKIWTDSINELATAIIDMLKKHALGGYSFFSNQANYEEYTENVQRALTSYLNKNPIELSRSQQIMLAGLMKSHWEINKECDVNSIEKLIKLAGEPQTQAKASKMGLMSKTNNAPAPEISATEAVFSTQLKL